MVRIGVNIPNELVKRLEPLKPELNISQVCRDALARHVERYENAIVNLNYAESSTGLEQAVAEKIRRRSIINVDWEALGYEDAVAWVQAATWEDWRQWQGIQNLLKRQGRPPWDIQPSIRDKDGGEVKCFDDRWWNFRKILMAQSDEFFEWLDDNGIDTGSFDGPEREYGRAWFAYISTAWDKIQQMHEEYYQAIRKERLEKRRNRPEVEVPEHILADVERAS